MKKVLWVRLGIFCLMAVLILTMVLVKPSRAPEAPTPTQPVTEPATEPATQPGELVLPEEVPAWVEYVEGRQLTAEQYFIWQVDKGFVKASDTPDTRIFPASITKLMTALVALEHLKLDTYVTAGDELEKVDPESSIAWIKKGDTLTVAQLLEGMLLPSGNDAAYVMAAAAGRKILGDNNAGGKEAAAAFVDEMNRRAVQLGLTASHFMNPDGIHSEEHYMSMLDLAKLGQLCLQNKTILQYTTLAEGNNPRYDENNTDIYAPKQWKNTNALVQPDSDLYCPNAVGLKTGQTSAAGACLLSAFRFGGREYVIGVFRCPMGQDRFQDTLYLLAQVLEYAE